MSLAGLKGKIFEFQNSIFRFLLRIRFPIEQRPKVEFVGNGYSGYWFPTEWLKLQGTVWGVGLGKDSSFEYKLQEKGYRLYGFEPEKNVSRHLKSSLLASRFLSLIMDSGIKAAVSNSQAKIFPLLISLILTHSAKRSSKSIHFGILLKSWI